MVGIIEVAAYEMGYTDVYEFKELAEPIIKSGYCERLLDILRKGDDKGDRNSVKSIFCN